MEIPRHEFAPDYSDLKSLLLSLAAHLKELDEAASRHLNIDKNVNAFYNTTLERAKLISDLPVTINDFKEKGGEVSVEVEDFVASLASMAQRAIEADNVFVMSVLLTEQGSADDEPDVLEKLVQNLRIETE